MTGEKDRYKTQEKLWKIDDEQLATPKHDEMVLQLLSTDYCKKLFPELSIEPEYKYSGKDFVFSQFIVDNIGSVKNKDWILKNKEKIFDPKYWSYFLDQCEYLETLYSTMEEEYTLTSKKQDITISAETPITNNKFIIGYWDVVISRSVYVGLREFKLNNNPILGIFIEVKPKVDSFGKVLRQINTYMEYYKNREGCIFCLYTPDTQYDAAFESQGIKVIHPL